MLAVQLFVKAVGGELALIVALVAMAYGMYNGASLTGVANGAATWATNLMQLAQSLIKGVGDFYKDAITEIQKEMQRITEGYKESLKTIESANELLENQNILSPYVIFGETPSQFYTRTTGTSMLNTLGLELPHTYVDTALTLPTLNETL